MFRSPWARRVLAMGFVGTILVVVWVSPFKLLVLYEAKLAWDHHLEAPYLFLSLRRTDWDDWFASHLVIPTATKEPMWGPRFIVYPRGEVALVEDTHFVESRRTASRIRGYMTARIRHPWSWWP